MLRLEVLIDSGRSTYAEFNAQLSRLRAEFLRAVLAHSGGNRSMAARSLNMDRSNLLRLMRKFGLQDSSRGVSK